MERTNQSPTAKGRIWIFSSAVISVVLIIAGFSYYNIEKNRIRLEEYKTISSIAELKVRQIEGWRSERFEDARVFSGSSFPRKAVLNLIKAQANTEIRRAIQEQLALEGKLGVYTNAFIIDTFGRTLVSIGGSSYLDTSERETLHETVSEHNPMMSDLFRGASGAVRIDVMAPILDESGKTAAVVVLRSDANSFLYPLINLWPVPSHSAETLLLEKKGNHILFLNNLRYHPNAALSESIPLTSATVPAVEAAKGKVGLFDGKDYRGEEVLADLRPVPNTPWFMVAKVDKSEILAEAKYRGYVAILFVILFMAFSSTATAYAYRHRQAGIYRALYHAEVERRDVEEEFKATLYSIGDGVITTDIHGLVRQMNRVAENLTGWTEQEAKGKPLEEIFQIINEPTRSAVESPVPRVLSEGMIVGLANHTILVSRDDHEYPITDSGAPIRDESGMVTGVVLIFRDRTKERTAEEKANRLAAIVQSSEDAIIGKTLDGIITSWNRGAEKIYGYAEDEMIGKPISILVPPGNADEVPNILERLRSGENIEHYETVRRRKDGQEIQMSLTISPIHDTAGNVVAASTIGRDITERKYSELALLESQQMLKTILDTIPARVFWKDKKGVYLGCNAAFAKDSGFHSTDEITGKDDLQMVWREQAEAYRADDLQVIESNIPKLGYEEPQSFDHGIRWLRTNKVPLRNAKGDVVGVLGTYEDVTESKHAASLLAYERYLLDALLENTVDRIYFKDAEGRFTRASASTAIASGLSVDQLLGKTDFDLFTIQQAQRTHDQEQQVIRTGKPLVNAEIEETWVDRPSTWASVTKVPLRDHEGKIVGIFGITRDITERKRAEEVLKKSDENFQRIMNSIHDIVYSVDGKTQEFTYISPAFDRLLGYTIEDVRQMGGRRAFLSNVIQEGKFTDQESTFEHLLKKKSEVPVWEAWWRCKDGRLVYLEDRSVPVYTDGQLVSTQGILSDITERKNAEIALRESEEKFRSLVEGSSAAIWIHDGERFLYANPAAMELTGYAADEFYKMAPMEIVHPDSRQFVMNRANERLKGNDVPKHYEYRIMKKSGEALWIDFSGSTINYLGKAAIIASAYDITERKNLEDQLVQAQKMEGIGRLAGGIAHDYNNMLGVIIGYSDLLINKINKTDLAYRYVELIASAAKRGADITRQLLAFARREIISPRVLNPNEAIESLQKMLQSLIGENIKLMFLPAKNVWNVRIDKTQLDQILVNLATNARDAIDDVGTITIETSNASLDQAYVQSHIDFSPGEYVVISFTDTGKGMSKEAMEKIFEPFFTTKSRGQGTGLGLSTVYGIIMQNHGGINVYSELNTGTTFRIYLPRYQAEVEEAEPAQVEESVSGSETVLIVEDQADLLELARNSLEQYGYRVLTALSPGEAIMVCTSHESEIHLLLTDVIMPTMNGKELRDKIQTIKPDIKSIFMSGYTANVIAHRGVLEEGVHFIQKPFTPYLLAKKVHEVLRG